MKTYTSPISSRSSRTARCNRSSLSYFPHRDTIPFKELQIWKRINNLQVNYTLEDRVKVVIGKNKIFIPSIEEQIVYKRIILGSDKDKEDARHLDEIFKLFCALVIYMKITENGIVVDKELSDLDKFAIRFCRAVEKNTKYVIVSGYVSILLGRSRSSEDIDMLIPKLTKQEWLTLFDNLVNSGYYCMNAGRHESYDYLMDNTAVRFAPKKVVVPNMEILFALNKIQQVALSTYIPVKLRKIQINVSNLELQIAYKEKILGSPKDIEDARHLRGILGKNINMKKLIEYEKMVNEEK
jgi:hypothetical protein